MLSLGDETQFSSPKFYKKNRHIKTLALTKKLDILGDEN
jgi:hypothetical protein